MNNYVWSTGKIKKQYKKVHILAHEKKYRKICKKFWKPIEIYRNICYNAINTEISVIWKEKQKKWLLKKLPPLLNGNN